VLLLARQQSRLTLLTHSPGLQQQVSKRQIQQRSKQHHCRHDPNNSSSSRLNRQVHGRWMLTSSSKQMQTVPQISLESSSSRWTGA
jgi:hypothetical protein